jgi:hypothetical protein
MERSDDRVGELLQRPNATMTKRRAALTGNRLKDTDDVLAGRVDVRPDELFDLIHRINPTGEPLRASEMEKRYALKARLQSLLIRRFGEALEVVGQPDNQPIVSIRLRSGQRDACHAVLGALDEDARSWVKLRMDLADLAENDDGAASRTIPRDPPRTRRAAAPVRHEREMEAETYDELLCRATRAIEAFDYHQARGDLERALTMSGGAPEPAAQLLSLLVDTLGDDLAALALETSLPRATLADPDVRGLLALAAGRLGNEERARDLLRGIREPRCAEVFAALSASALRRGDDEQASAYLQEARRRDLSHLAITAAAEAIAHARTAAREPRETELLQAAEAGRDQEAAAEAREVLARWPESEVARRVLRIVDERARQSEARRLVAEADEALRAGQTAEALARLRQARGPLSGAERAGIDERIGAIEAAQRRQSEAASVEWVCGLLDGPELSAGLLAYLELNERLRREVREKRALDALGWLELMESARLAGAKRRVEAALAFEAARALDADQAEAAEELLAPHEEVLQRVPEVRRAAQEIRERARKQRIDRARAEIAAARRWCEAGDADAALRILGGALVPELPGEDAAEAAAIRAQATLVVERGRLARRAEELRTEDRLFEARALVEKLAAGAAPPEQGRWLAERDAITAEIQRQWRVSISDAPAASAELRRFGRWHGDDTAPCWLLTSGDEIVLVKSAELWIVIEILDCSAGEIRRSVLLRAPEPLKLLKAHGAVRSSCLIDEADGERQTSLAVSREQGLVFITYERFSSTRELLALAWENEALAPLYRVPIGEPTILVQDACARKVFALHIGKERARAIELGRTPPDLPRENASYYFRLPNALDVAECDAPTGARNAPVLALTVWFQSRPWTEIATWIRERQTAPDAEPETLVDAVFALRRGDLRSHSEARRLTEWLWETYPDHPEVRLLRAGALASAGSWSEARDALAWIHPDSLDAGWTQHFHHLSALSSLVLGRTDDALRAALAARDIEQGRCDLGNMFDLLEPPAESLASASPAADEDELSSLRELISAIRIADAHLVTGDPHGAIRALDIDAVWAAKEVQSLARLAEALLLAGPAWGRDHIRAVLALGAFCDAAAEAEPMLRRELPVPGATWEPARLRDLVERAKKWLETEGGSAEAVLAVPRSLSINSSGTESSGQSS